MPSLERTAYPRFGRIIRPVSWNEFIPRPRGDGMHTGMDTGYLRTRATCFVSQSKAPTESSTPSSPTELVLGMALCEFVDHTRAGVGAVEGAAAISRDQEPISMRRKTRKKRKQPGKGRGCLGRFLTSHNGTRRKSATGRRSSRRDSFRYSASRQPNPPGKACAEYRSRRRMGSFA
jgi:hypothetical protein